jgi:hypothetical protein
MGDGWRWKWRVRGAVRPGLGDPPMFRGVTHYVMNDSDAFVTASTGGFLHQMRRT